MATARDWNRKKELFTKHAGCKSPFKKDVSINFPTFSFKVSSELVLANKVYYVKSMTNKNFILSCKG